VAFSGPLVITGSAVISGAMRVPLHVRVVLLCSVYRACPCSLLFKAPHPIPPLLLYFLYSLIVIYSVSFPMFFQFSVMGAGARAGAGFFCQAGLVAGLQVGRALGCSGCLGLGSAVPSLHIACDEGVNTQLKEKKVHH